MDSKGIKLQLYLTLVVFLMLAGNFRGNEMNLIESDFSHHPATPKSWEYLESDYPDAFFYDLDFINITHGWISGVKEGLGSSSMVVLYTQDSGDTWATKLDDEEQRFPDLEIVNEHTVWVTAKRKLLFTNNSGDDWYTSTPVQTVSSYSVVKFINNTHGLTANKDALYRTSDGGISWTTLTGWTFEDDLPRHMEFLDHSAILAIGWFGIYYSNDFGESWERVHDRGGWSLAVSGDSGVWAVGDNEFMHSTDYFTWINLPIPNRAPLPHLLTPYLSDIYFLDATNGWIVGDLIPIMYTPDGGTSWYEQSASEEITGRLMAVDFVNATSGWAVGSNGIILRTAQGNLLESRLWLGVTDPLFLLIISSVGVIVAGYVYRRKRMTSKPKSHPNSPEIE